MWRVPEKEIGGMTCMGNLERGLTWQRQRERQRQEELIPFLYAVMGRKRNQEDARLILARAERGLRAVELRSQLAA